VVEAAMETATAIANSRMRLKEARTCLNLAVYRLVQYPTSRIMLQKKVRPAAMMRKAAKLLKSF
jgi:hypothetical protein